MNHGRGHINVKPERLDSCRHDGPTGWGLAATNPHEPDAGRGDGEIAAAKVFSRDSPPRQAGSSAFSHPADFLRNQRTVDDSEVVDPACKIAAGLSHRAAIMEQGVAGAPEGDVAAMRA